MPDGEGEVRKMCVKKMTDREMTDRESVGENR
jgi:hypothetical protein